MSHPQKVGALAAPSFMEPRFKKDKWVTDKVARNRGRNFELFSEDLIPKLSKPSLISSSHGIADHILMTLPWWLFLRDGDLDDISPEELESTIVTANSFKSILNLLPTQTRFLILVNDKAIYDGRTLYSPLERVNEWLSELERTQNSQVVTAPSTTRFTMWAEDAYAISQDLEDSEIYFVEPASFRRGDDALIADLISPATNLERTQVTLYFQGGNILIGDDFWFIGMDYPRNSLDLGYITPQQGETDLQAVTRAYGAGLDHDRQFLQIGSRLPVPGHFNEEYQTYALVQKFDNNGEEWVEFLYSGNAPGTAQPMFHIDMFITLVGKNEDGNYTVLVGDPNIAAEILRQPLQAHAMAEIYNDIADQLKTLGFNVIRNPLPLTYDDDSNKKERTWYFATSNNCLVQVTEDEKIVWLPTYGHRKWPELIATDEENKRIWEEELEFTVHQLGDFHPFAVNLGAAHCVTKYLSRT